MARVFKNDEVSQISSGIAVWLYFAINFREVLKIPSDDDSLSLVLELGTPEKNAEYNEGETCTECPNGEEIANESEDSELSAVKNNNM